MLSIQSFWKKTPNLFDNNLMKGIAVSKGIAIGKAYLLDRSKFCIIKQNLQEKPSCVQHLVELWIIRQI